jgi:hypothetical protein
MVTNIQYFHMNTEVSHSSKMLATTHKMTWRHKHLNHPKDTRDYMHHLTNLNFAHSAYVCVYHYLHTEHRPVVVVKTFYFV